MGDIIAAASGAPCMPATRILALFRHPTPYRDPLFDRVAALPDVDLEVLYLGRTFAQTPWETGPLGHRHAHPRGFLRFERSGHEMAFHPGVLARLLSFRPHACVVSGWADPSLVAAAAACRLLRVPYVLCSESFEASGRFTGAPRGVAARVRTAVVRGAAAWLPAGSRARDYLVSMGADPARCHFFPTAPDARGVARAVDELRLDAGLRASLGLPGDGVVLFVGRVVPDKAPEVLADAFALLRRERPAHLLVVGDGPMLGEMRRRAGESDATYAGFLQPPEVLRRLAAADVLVLPSRFETWGAVATEALAAGLPVVLSDRVGCAPDVLGGPEPPGEVVPCEDATTLAAALSRVLADPRRRSETAARARRRAFAWGHDLNLASLVAALRDAGASMPDPPAPAGVS